MPTGRTCRSCWWAACRQWQRVATQQLSSLISNSACSFGLCCELETCLDAHLTLSGWRCAAGLLKEAIVGKLQKGQGMAMPPSTHVTCSQHPVPSAHSLLTLKSGMAVE